MAKKNVFGAIRFFEQELRKKNVQVKKIILFGSQAEGKSSAESDVDLLLISEDFKGKDIFKRLALVKDAEIATIKKYLIPLDVIMMTTDEFASGKSLVSEFAKKGKEVSVA